MIAKKSWMRNDQLPKNMEQVINAKCNQEEGLHWPASRGNTSQGFENEARIN